MLSDEYILDKAKERKRSSKGMSVFKDEDVQTAEREVVLVLVLGVVEVDNQTNLFTAQRGNPINSTATKTMKKMDYAVFLRGTANALVGKGKT